MTFRVLGEQCCFCWRKHERTGWSSHKELFQVLHL